MLKYAISVSVCCLTFEVNAATVLLRDYKAPKSEELKAFNELYIGGVMEGFLTANAKLATEGKSKMFCLPPEKELSAQEAAEIMMHQAKTAPDTDNYPISILLLAGLADTFPCERPTGRTLPRTHGAEPARQSQSTEAQTRKHRAKPSKALPKRPRKAKSSHDALRWRLR
jgi:hypothetical protein